MQISGVEMVALEILRSCREVFGCEVSLDGVGRGCVVERGWTWLAGWLGV
jgi:hypothetical protein